MILISGGGFLGLNTAIRLGQAGERVVVTTRRRNDAVSARVAAESNGLVTVEVLDLTNAYDVSSLFSRYDFKRVVHTATAHMFASTRAANFPSYQMLFNTLEAATSFGVERFVLCNSIVVYRGVDGPFREDQRLPPEFETAGGGLAMAPAFEVTLKRVMEALTLDYGLPMTIWAQAPKTGGKPRAKPLETAVLRFPAQVGPLYSSMYNPIARLTHAYVKNQPGLLMEPPLRPFVDISYSRDNADAVASVALADTLPHRIYNVSSNIHVTAREVLESLYRVAPDARDVLKLEPGDQPNKQSDQYLDISRIEDDLGWTPKFTIDALLSDYISWLSRNEY